MNENPKMESIGDYLDEKTVEKNNRVIERIQ
jgi:hypothetical protein